MPLNLGNLLELSEVDPIANKVSVIEINRKLFKKDVYYIKDTINYAYSEGL